MVPQTKNESCVDLWTFKDFEIMSQNHNYRSLLKLGRDGTSHRISSYPGCWQGFVVRLVSNEVFIKISWLGTVAGPDATCINR